MGEKINEGVARWLERMRREVDVAVDGASRIGPERQHHTGYLQGLGSAVEWYCQEAGIEMPDWFVRLGR
jgi:hypothetical protein